MVPYQIGVDWGGDGEGGGRFQLTDPKNSSKSYTSQVRTVFLKEIYCLGKKVCIYLFIFFFSL